jgi:hypothetical protein
VTETGITDAAGNETYGVIGLMTGNDIMVAIITVTEIVTVMRIEVVINAGKAVGIDMDGTGHISAHLTICVILIAGVRSDMTDLAVEMYNL